MRVRVWPLAGGDETSSPMEEQLVLQLLAKTRRRWEQRFNVSVCMQCAVRLSD
jgi:hypothetical protein